MSPTPPQQDAEQRQLDGIVVKVFRAGEGVTFSHLVYVPRSKQMCLVPFALFEKELPPDASKGDVAKWSLKERQYRLGASVIVTVAGDAPNPEVTDIQKGRTGRWNTHPKNDFVFIRSRVVFSPDSPLQCHSQLFSDCRIPDRLDADTLLRNVCFDAWLRLEVRETELDLLTDAACIATITALVDEMEGIAAIERDARDHIVLTAPWNKDEKPLVARPLDGNGSVAKSPREANMLLGEEGFLLKQLTHIFNPRTPDDAVRIGCLRPEQAQDLAPGQWVRFDAFYCRFNKCFVVTNLKPIPDRRVVTRVNGGRRQRTLYKLAIAKSAQIPGYFVALELGNDCLVADPNCFLWQRRDASHVDLVWARFVGNNAAAKFIVEEVFNEAGAAVKNLPNMPRKINEQGIYVGGPNRRIFCPRWPLLDISQEEANKCQVSVEILPGQLINFKAVHACRGYVYYAGDATPAYNRRASDYRLTPDGPTFLARLRAVSDRACYSDTFGLAQDPLRLIEVNGLNNGRVFLAWIRHGPFADDQTERVRTASFELVTLDATEEEISVPRGVQVVQRKSAATEAAIPAALPQRLHDEDLLASLGRAVLVVLAVVLLLFCSEYLHPVVPFRFMH